MNALTPLAVSAEPLLRAIASGEHATKADIAIAAGRNPKNAARDLSRLFPDLIDASDPPKLNAAGIAALEALDRTKGDDTVSPVANAVRATGITTLRHDQIHVGALNPRKAFEQEALEELAADILDRGLKANLHVRALVGDATTHELIAGERRYRAIGLLIKRGDLPADYPILALVEDMDDEGHRVAALLENLQRVQLTPLEEAEAFDVLVNGFGLTTAQVAERMKRKSREFVQQRLRLNKLTEAEKRQMEAGSLSIHDALKRIAARPVPLELTALEAVVMGEVVAAIGGDDDMSWWQLTDIAFTVADDQVAAALIERGLLEVRQPDKWQHCHRIKLASHDVWTKLSAFMPGVIKAADRKSALLGLRAAAVGADAAEGADSTGQFITPWLNGPFELTEEGKAFAAQAEAEAAESEARNAEAKAAQDRDHAEQKAAYEREMAQGGEFLAAVRAFESTPRARIDFETLFAAVVEPFGFTAPFSVGLQGDALVLFDAAGKLLAWRPGPGFEAIRRLQAIALNHAFGAPIYSGDDIAVAAETADPDQSVDGSDPEAEASEDEEADEDADEDVEQRIAAEVETSGLPEHVVRQAFESAAQ